MARVSYTALRSLKNGVSVNDTVHLDFEVTKLDRSTKPQRTDHISLDGSQVSSRDRTDILFRVETVPALSLDDFRQFLDSVDGGETFTFDPYGTFASPVAAQTAVLSSKGYKEKRTNQRWLSVSFTVRIVP